MNNDKNDGFSELFKVFSVGIILIIISSIVFPIAVMGIIIKSKPHLLVKDKVEKISLSMQKVGLFVLFFCVLVHFSMYISSKQEIAIAILVAWSIQFLFFKQLVNLLKVQLRPKRITTESLKKSVEVEENFIDYQNDESNVYVGCSYLDGELYKIPVNKLSYHTMVIGASGSGKTSLMKALASRCFIHKEPIVIIDPKGDRGLQEELIELISSVNTGKKQRISVFRLGSSEGTMKYNPLKYGTISTLTESIMSSFEFSEEYYKGVAERYMTDVITVLLGIDETVTFLKIDKLIHKNKEFVTLVKKKISLIKDQDKVTTLDHKLGMVLSTERTSIDGLGNQISFFTQKEMLEQFNPSENEAQIDFRDILNNNEVLIVDLRTNVYTKAGYKLGRLLTNDILRLAGQIGESTSNIKPKNFHIMIDEFGSVVTSSAGDMFQKCRSAGICLSVFTQTLSTIRIVSQELLESVLGNTKFKFTFLNNVPDDVDLLVKSIGTLDTLENSYQIKKNILGKLERTGAGNLRLTKSVKVEHDVIKNLPTGTCVASIAGERDFNVDLIKVWNVESKKIRDRKRSHKYIWDNIKPSFSEPIADANLKI